MKEMYSGVAKWGHSQWGTDATEFTLQCDNSCLHLWKAKAMVFNNQNKLMLKTNQKVKNKLGQTSFIWGFFFPQFYFFFFLSWHGGDGFSWQSEVASYERREIHIVKPPLVSHGSPSESDDHAVWRYCSPTENFSNGQAGPRGTLALSQLSMSKSNPTEAQMWKRSALTITHTQTLAEPQLRAATEEPGLTILNLASTCLKEKKNPSLLWSSPKELAFIIKGILLLF